MNKKKATGVNPPVEYVSLKEVFTKNAPPTYAKKPITTKQPDQPDEVAVLPPPPPMQTYITPFKIVPLATVPQQQLYDPAKGEPTRLYVAVINTQKQKTPQVIDVYFATPMSYTKLQVLLESNCFISRGDVRNGLQYIHLELVVNPIYDLNSVLTFLEYHLRIALLANDGDMLFSYV